MCGRGDGALELNLLCAHGRIWERRPRTTNEGVVVRALNSCRRNNDSVPVAFSAVAFNGDGQICAAADRRGYLYLLYLELNRYSLICDESPGPRSNALCFTGRRCEGILCGAKCTVRVFDVDTQRRVSLLSGHQREVCAISANGIVGLVLTQSADVTILWDIEDWTRKRTLQAVAAPMNKACFSPMGDMLAVLFRDARISIWRTATLSFVMEMRPEADGCSVSLQHLAISEAYAAAAGGGCLVYVWSLSCPEGPLIAELDRPAISLLLGRLRWYSGIVEDALYMLLDDGQVVVANAKSFEIELTLQPQGRAFVAVAVCCHCKHMILAVSDGSLEIREVGRCIQYEQQHLEQRVRLGVLVQIRRCLKLASKSVVQTKTSPLGGWPTPDSGEEDELEQPCGDFSGHRPALRRGVSADSPGQRQRQRRRCSAQPQQGRSARLLSCSEPSSASSANSKENLRNLGSPDVFASSSDTNCRVCPERQQQRPPIVFESPPSSSRPLMRRTRSAGLPRSVGGVYFQDGASARKRDSPRDLLDRVGLDVEGARERSRDLVLDAGPTHSRAQSGEVRKGVDDLRQMLQNRGDLSQGARASLWRRLLRLPGNVAAFEAIQARGIHPRYKHLHEQYPFHTRVTLQRLTLILSAVAHWAPSLAGAPYLPSLVFPFVKIFGTDLVLAFETIITVLLNWTRPWIEEWPRPPLDLLSRLEDCLVNVDPGLHSHLRALCKQILISEPVNSFSVASSVLWPLLQTVLTKVLPKECWLQLWDHLVTFWTQPWMLHAAIVAFLQISRESLLQLSSWQGLDEWLGQPHTVHLPALVDAMFELQPSLAILGSVAFLPRDDLPLPKGRYPVFFPASTISAKFGHGAQEEGPSEATVGPASSLHKNQFQEIRTAARRLCEEESCFRKQQEEVLRAEEIRRRIASEEADRLLEEKRAADERVLAKRLQQVKDLYHGVEEMLEQQRRARSLEGEQFLDDLRRRHKERTYELQARLKEEAVMNLELRGTQCASELLRRRRDEESRRSLEALVQGRRREQELRDEAQKQQWRVEDEAERAKLVAIREQQIVQDQLEAQHTRQREVEMELRLQELEREVQLAQVARERIIRRARRDAVAAAEANTELQRRRRELEERNLSRDRELSIAQAERELKRRQQERADLVEKETSRWRVELEMRLGALEEEEANQARRDFETRVAQLHQEDREQEAADEALLLEALERGTGGVATALSSSAGGSQRREHVGGYPNGGERLSRAQKDEGSVRDLEELIRQREQELQALWRDLDKNDAGEAIAEESSDVEEFVQEAHSMARPARDPVIVCSVCAGFGIDYLGRPCKQCNAGRLLQGDRGGSTVTDPRREYEEDSDFCFSR